VDPRAGLDNMEKRKFLTLRDSNSVQLVASRYTDYAMTTSDTKVENCGAVPLLPNTSSWHIN
jgi:hypothetical protein